MLRRLLLTAFATLVLTAALGASPVAAQEAPPPPPTLRQGDTGPEVQEMEQRLRNAAYDPGPIDGKFDQTTVYALWAFKKAQELPVNSEYTPDVRERLVSGNIRAPHVLNMGNELDRVEIHLGFQLMTVYRDGIIFLVSHISSGNNQRYCVKGRCGRAITPRGGFVMQRKINGWRTGRLGRMYNPHYFTSSGHAIHGSTSVPLHPASHGCVRVPMHTANVFPRLMFRGMPIYIAG